MCGLRARQQRGRGFLKFSGFGLFPWRWRNERGGFFTVGGLCLGICWRGESGAFFGGADLEGVAMSGFFTLAGRKVKQPKKGSKWLSRSSFGRGIQRFFSAQSRNDEQDLDGTRVYIQQHPAEAGLYSFSELWKEGRLLSSEELAQIEDRSRKVASSLLWSDRVPVDDLSDMGALCVWDVPRLMGMISLLSSESEAAPSSQAQEVRP
jgi:hypothetical protein